MIIKIFKIETCEMAIINCKKGLIKFIKTETGMSLSNKMTIKQLVSHLPVEQYYRIK